MPNPIPHKLHFIWVGNPLPAPYAETLLKWAAQNTRYDVYLWTEFRLIDSIRNTLTQAAEHHPDFITKATPKTAEHPDGATITILRKHVMPIHIFIFAIETLEAQSSPILLYEEMTQWRRYGSVSDILRLWVLYNHGGIYFDMDVLPVSNHIPLNIEAPRGILFAEMPEGIPGIMVSIVASPQRSYAVKSLLKFIDAGIASTPLLTEGIMKITDNSQYLYSRIEEYRQKLKDAGTAQSFRRDALKRTLEVLMRTASGRTGTVRVYDWISEREGTDVDTKYRVSVDRSITEVETIELDDGTEEMYLYNDTIAGLYSFQRQANFYPIMEVHGSWIK